MQAEIDAENKIFLESERTPKDIEKREKAILEIRKRYAIEELRVALVLTEALARSEQDEVKKARLLKAVAELKSAIMQLQSDEAVDIAEGEADKIKKLEKIKQDAFNQTAKTLSDSLGLSEGALNKFFDSLNKEVGILEKVGAATAVVGDIGSAIFDRNIQQYDEEIQANNDFYAKKLDNENLSEEQRSQLEAERERKNAELEKKKRDEQIKQAKLNKAFAALNIGLNTAQALLAIASTGGGTYYADFGISAATLSAIVVGLGAAQVAAVLAAPIPKYKHGRTGGKAEFAFVGDGGVNEIIERAKGGYEITPSTDTLTYLGQGDKVHPDANKFLQEQAYNISLSAQGRTIEQAQPKIDIDTLNKTIKEQTAALMSGLKDSKTNVRIHNNNSIGEDLKFLNKQNDEIQ